MTEILFTTIDVAQMLYVDKSTVKRWTDEGKLKCFRTPGGHRKFRAEDLYAFVTQYNYGVTPINLFPQFASDEAVIRQIIIKKEYNVLASVCFSAAIKGKKDDVLKLFTEVHRYGLALPVLFDEILCPTLKRIHDLFVSGKLSAPEHQLAVNALSTATLLMSDVIVKPSLNGKRAICATIEKESDDILLKALTVLLESEGYDVLNLGVGVSAADVIQLAKSRNPQFVYLLAAQMNQQNAFEAQHELLMNELAGMNSALILCGSGYAAENLGVTVCASFVEMFAMQHGGPAPRAGHSRAIEVAGTTN
ncbi:MAG: helix-turn-helix domain-containing protein [Ignavibacteriales bacterium]|nr:helix-turn-helix domain-containing protein [Ignavibacteriales bacterium]